MDTTKPKEYENILGEYRGQSCDGYSDETTRWGWRVDKWLEPDAFQKLRENYPLFCVGEGEWFVVGHELTPEEAEKKYGRVAAVVVGPMGGFRMAMYGKTIFMSKLLDPRLDPSDPRVKKIPRGGYLSVEIVHEDGTKYEGTW